MIRPITHRQATIHGFGMGRIFAPDVRDYQYRYSAVKKQIPASVAKVPKYSRVWNVRHNLPLDQGQTPRCVGFSLTTLLLAGPVYQPNLIPDADHAFRFANDLYLKALDVDEWEGNDPCCGTSGRAGLEVLRAGGTIGGYAWAESTADVIDFVLKHGPVVCGTVWPDSMMDTDPDGFLHVAPNSTLDGPNAEGHEWCVNGLDKRMRCPDGSRGAFWMMQTWGKGWGKDGTGAALVPFTDFDVLFKSGGDVAMPTEIQLKAAPHAT